MKLLTAIVPHDRGEKLTRAALEAGSRGGTVLMARSLAKSNLAAILGLGESTRDVILMVVSDEAASSVLNAVESASAREKKGFGEVFLTHVGSLVKGGQFRAGSALEKEKPMDEMITAIVNKGYADDVMAAARSAGAGGGTVVGARGTARENDARFFGMHIVPEKEMLIMVVSSEKKEAVMAAIRNVKCLKEPGMGIAYSSPVEDFCLLGKKK